MLKKNYLKFSLGILGTVSSRGGGGGPGITASNHRGTNVKGT